MKLRRCLVAALEQQMWFFGCDAACADGNLLVRYGFVRHRLEDHRGESSCYRVLWRPISASQRSAGTAADGRAQIDLHGWCAGLHTGGRVRTGGFLYARAGNRLGWYDAPEPPLPGEYDDDPAARRAFRLLGRRPEPGFRHVAALFIRWLEEYESWIERICGPGYRRRCHARAPLPWLPPAEARGWLARYHQAITPAPHPPESQPIHQPNLP